LPNKADLRQTLMQATLSSLSPWRTSTWGTFERAGHATPRK